MSPLPASPAPHVEPKPLPVARPEKVLLFIGCGRSGSTLLGQVLNSHPECLVANESRVLTRWAAGEATFEALVREAARAAYEQFHRGLERSGRFALSNARVQPRWRPFAGLSEDPAFAKRVVRVVGDKKAGGASQAIMAHERAVAGLMTMHPIVLLQVVRDPVACALSAVRALGEPSFASACERIVAQSAAAHRFGARFAGRYHLLAYEDLCAAPRAELTRLAAWLGVPAAARWLHEMAARIDDPRSGAADPALAAECRAIVRAHGAGALFERYEAAAVAA